MFGIFVGRFEHSSDLCAMASKVLWPLRATPKTPTVRSGTFESCFQHFGSFCRVLCTCVRKMRSRVRRVCGARARTSWSFLPSFQSPGAAAAPPRRDLKWRQFSHRGFVEKIRKGNNVNWMNILRLAFKLDPISAKKIMKKINYDDKKISNLLSKLGK